MPLSASDARRQARNIAFYLLAFFAVWTVRATLLYPIDETIQSASAAWRQIYADAVRLVLWVMPVLVYLSRVDRVRPLRFLGLSTRPNGKGLVLGRLLVVAYFLRAVGLEYGLTARPR
jgi:hypothetical protein